MDDQIAVLAWLLAELQWRYGQHIHPVYLQHQRTQLVIKPTAGPLTPWLT